MADAMTQVFSGFGDTAKAAAGSTYDVVIWIGVFAVIGTLIFLVFWYMSFNRRVTVNYETRGGVRLVIFDKAKLKKVRGANYWKLMRLKKQWLAPPGEAVRITIKGKFYAECNYKEGDDRPAWIILKESEPVTVDGERMINEQTYFSPEDRALLVEQLEEANNRNKNLLNTLMQLAVPAMFIIMLVVVLIFWKDIWEPMKESQGAMATIAKEQAKISEQNARLFSIMAGKLDIGELKINQVVPGDNTLFYGNATG